MGFWVAKKISNLLKRMLSWLQKAMTWSLDMLQLSCVAWATRSDPFQEELTLLHLQFLRQRLQPTLSSHSRSVDNDLMLSSKAEIQVRTGILILSNLHWSGYNFAVMNQSFKCSGLNFRPGPGQSHLVNVPFNATTVRRIGRWTEDKKSISKSFRKRKGTRFSAWKRAVRESSRIQNGFHAPKYTSFHKALKEISDFETFPLYLLSTFVCLGRSFERMCLLQRGLERKEQSRRRECSEHWKCTDTSLKSWPFWQLPASRRHHVRARTITFQPLHRLQHCSNFFIISGFFFCIASRWHLGRYF